MLEHASDSNTDGVSILLHNNYLRALEESGFKAAMDIEL